MACLAKVFILLLTVIARPIHIGFSTHLKLTSGIAIAFLPLQLYALFHHRNVPCADIIHDMFILVPLGSLRSVCVQCCRHVAADRFIKKTSVADSRRAGHGPPRSDYCCSKSCIMAARSRSLSRVTPVQFYQMRLILGASCPGFIPCGIFGDACTTNPGRRSYYLALFFVPHGVFGYFFRTLVSR